MRLHLNANPKKQNGKTYTYYSLASSYRDEQGVPRKKIFQRLGQLSDKEAHAWRLKLALLNGDPANLVEINALQFTASKRYLDVAILSQIYDRLGLNNVFKILSTKATGLHDVAKILVLSRCLDPQANYRTVDWFCDSYLPQLMDINPTSYNKDKIFHELADIHDRQPFLQKLFFEQSLKNNGGEFGLFFFDATTSYFEGWHCDLGHPGKDKTTGYQDKMVLICLLTDRHGSPLAWNVLPGDRREISEFYPLVGKFCNENKVTNVTFCFDRGIASEANFKAIEKKLFSKYLSGIDSNQIASVFNVDAFAQGTRAKLLEAVNQSSGCGPKTIVPINGFYHLSEERFYKDLGVDTKNPGKRHVVGFCASIYHHEQETRRNLLLRIEKKIDDMNLDLAQAGGDRDEDVLSVKINELISKYRLSGVIEYNIIPESKEIKRSNGRKDFIQSFKIQYKINETRLFELQKLDGLFVYVTDHVEASNGHFLVSAGELVQHYKDKAIIENAFRHLKSVVDLRPMYVRLDEHVKAHVDICMCAYFINNYITRQLRPLGISIDEFYRRLEEYSRVCTLRHGTEEVTLLKNLPKEMKTIIDQLKVKSVLEKGGLQSMNIRPS